MKLIDINTYELNDEKIDRIVYSDIEDNMQNTIYGICFGNSMLIKERVASAVMAYEQGRIKKVIFCGGSNGISNQNNDATPEAIKMKELAVKLGIKEEDILIDDKSNNSFENIENSLNLLDINSLKSIALITSEFHLKRCMAIMKKEYPQIECILIHSKDGFSDRDNWFLSDNSWNSGRSLATFEAKVLVKYARENKIENLEIKSGKVK